MASKSLRLDDVIETTRKFRNF